MLETLIRLFFFNMFINSPIVLASSSASRKNILKSVGIRFVQKNPTTTEEDIKKKLAEKGHGPKKISLELSKAKSKSVCKKNKNVLVVGSDTVVYLDKKIINKAKTLKEAKNKIKKISGRAHKISSSCAVCFNNKIIWTTTQTTNVFVRRLSNVEINNYIRLCGKQILSSAGCYQIERLGPMIIEKIEGDFFNVMGFPLFPFLRFVKNFKMPK